VKYRLKFVKEENKFDWFLFSTFIGVLTLIFILLIFTCNNVRKVKRVKEDYASSFRKYIRGVRSGSFDRTLLVKKGLLEFEEEEDLDEYGYGYGSIGRNRVQYH
jgi:hypothetical protein